jgi:hypothetical protein
MDADDILLDFPTGTVVTPELVARRIAALSGATVLPNAGGPIGPEEPALADYAEEAELARLRSENAALLREVVRRCGSNRGPGQLRSPASQGRSSG